MVSAKRTGCSAPSCGRPTWTSPASTGSVGASTAPRSRAAPNVSPAKAHPANATAPIVSGIATASKPMVGRHSARGASRSMRSPTPNRPTTTHNSLVTSHGPGLPIGLTASAMPGMKEKARKPNRISSAEAAGSRPDTSRGSQ